MDFVDLVDVLGDIVSKTGAITSSPDHSNDDNKADNYSFSYTGYGYTGSSGVSSSVNGSNAATGKSNS